MMRRGVRFYDDESGTVLVLVGMCLAIFMGIMAITFDLGRLAATQTDLQAYVDNVALAAAGELDGGANAITRATAAANFMIRDWQTFGEGTQDLDSAADYSLRFLTGLPADDNADVSPFVTTNSEDAVLVEVTATPRTVFIGFANAMATMLGSTAPNNQVGAVAIAGYTQYACDIAPLMFCVPSGWTADANVGQTILLRSGGQSTAWGPGDFGFLDPSKIKVDPNGPCAGLNGVNLDACLIAASGNLTQCFRQRGVDIEPGQKVGIENAVFNTRFDMFNGIMSNRRNNRHYAPGPNVTKGIVRATGGAGNSCVGNNPAPSPDTMALPPDDCFGSGTCPGGSTRFGDGNWAGGRNNYVNMNHNGVDPDNTVNTRYEVYLAEIQNAGGEASNTPIVPQPKAETGRPQCSTAPTVANVERRMFVAAGIDCTENPINGAATDVPVAEFVKIFLMAPVGEGTGSPATFDLWVEVIGSAGGSGAGSATSGGVFRDVVELYR